jgi:hypothetical protein
MPLELLCRHLRALHSRGGTDTEERGTIGDPQAGTQVHPSEECKRAPEKKPTSDCL